MKERILAIVAAVALVAVAIVARSFIAGDDDADAAAGGGGRPVVACTADLMTICDALADDGRIADDPPTLDLNTKDAAAAKAKVGDRDLDGWITWDPAPAIVAIDDLDTWGDITPVAATRLAVATRGTNGLPEGCDVADLQWSCLAAAGPDTFALGVGPGTTSESLVRLYPVALALVPADSDFTDISANELADVRESPTDGQAAFPRQVTTLRTRPGALNVVVGPAGALAAADGLSTFEPLPDVSAAVVLAGRAEADLDLTKALGSARVTAAIRALGLTVDPDAELAPAERAGDLYALREKVG